MTATWSRTPPTEAGDWWWWNGDRVAMPEARLFRIEKETRLGFTYVPGIGDPENGYAIKCLKLGGWWCKAEPPALPIIEE